MRKRKKVNKMQREREREVDGRASAPVSKLPNYFSTCPRGPGKIIIKTSRGAG